MTNTDEFSAEEGFAPLDGRAPERPFGLFADEIRIGDDFEGPLPEEIAQAFDGSDS